MSIVRSNGSSNRHSASRMEIDGSGANSCLARANRRLSETDIATGATGPIGTLGNFEQVGQSFGDNGASG